MVTTYFKHVYFQTHHWCAQENFHLHFGTATTTVTVHSIRTSSSRPDTTQLRPFPASRVSRTLGSPDSRHNPTRFITDQCIMTSLTHPWVLEDTTRTLAPCFCSLLDQDISRQGIMGKRPILNLDIRITDLVPTTLRKTHFQVGKLYLMDLL